MVESKDQKRMYRDLDKARGKKRINVTLTADEYHFVKLKAEASGEPVTTYFKNAALHQMAAKRHLNESELAILRDAVIQIRKVGNNINQIAHQSNAGLSINTDELKYQLRYMESLVQQFFGKK